MRKPSTKPLHYCTQLLTSLLVLIALFASPARPALAATHIIYVTPGGTGAGASWADGKDLAAALAAAGSDTELRVKTGTYTPALVAEDSKLSTFTLKSGVALYGGYSGVGIERDVSAYPSILSGAVGTSSADDNSQHVVTASGVDATAILDGFTITDGTATDMSTPMGGGMYNIASSPTLSNLIFLSNTSASFGAGMANLSGSNPSLTQVTFKWNRTPKDSGTGGGALYNQNSSPHLSNVSFQDNAGRLGGAMLNVNSSPTLLDVTFDSNNASDNGGAMANVQDSRPSLTRVSFNKNYTSGEYGNGYGGGMYNRDSSPTLTHVTFIENGTTSAAGMGGAIYSSGGTPVLNDVTFDRNTSKYQAGAMYNADNAPLLTNVVFKNNQGLYASFSRGGAMYNSQSNPVMTNVTFESNAAAAGGAMFNAGSSPEINGGAFWGNMAAEGSGIRNTNSSPTLTNVSFNHNDINCFDPALSCAGSAMYNSAASHPILRNSILWGNADRSGSLTAQVTNSEDSTPHFGSSIIQNSGGSGAGWSAALGTDEGGNLDLDPLFVAAGSNLRLQPNSPAIDNGSNAYLPRPGAFSTDLDGNPRMLNGVVDLGGYEYQGAGAPPQTSLAGFPALHSNDRTPNFSFSSSEAGSSFTCQLDGGDWQACASPYTTPTLPDGPHTFSVRATDPAGNLDATPAAHAWTIDTLAPETAIDQQPETPSASNRARFAFSSPDAAASAAISFECRLDPAGWRPCASAVEYYPLKDGEYTFQVRAKDGAGNLDPSPASTTWRISGAPVLVLPKGDLSTGYMDACALTRAGGLDCWGATDLTPDQSIRAAQVAVGFMHACALTLTGAITCWGQDDNGAITQQAGPYIQVSAGYQYTCGLTAAGTVDCWGANTEGQATAQAGPYRQISTGAAHVCGLTPSGAVDCWGYNDYGQAAPQTGPYVQVSAGGMHTCALTADGAVDCWGSNVKGQAAGHSGPYVQVSAGFSHTCALAQGGAVDCWGDNSDGQATSHAGPYMEVSAGYLHTCALTPAGAVDCWGQLTGQAGPYGAPETSATLRESEQGVVFEFESSDPQASFTCRLDSGDWQPCASPRVYSAADLLGRTFQVRAVNAAGIPDPTPVSFTRPGYYHFLPLISR